MDEKMKWVRNLSNDLKAFLLLFLIHIYTYHYYEATGSDFTQNKSTSRNRRPRSRKYPNLLRFRNDLEWKESLWTRTSRDKNIS